MIPTNGTVQVEVDHGAFKRISSFPCRITPDKIVTLTRVYCPKTLAELRGIDGGRPHRVISYTIH